MAVIWEPTLSEESQRLRLLARETSETHFAPLAEEIDRTGRYPQEYVETLVETGLTGVFLPADRGGLGGDLAAVCAAMEEISMGCSTASSIFASIVMGAFPILLGGTDDQQSHYLGALNKEGAAASFALTEPHAGSDASATLTTAVDEGDAIRIRGEKWFVGNGGKARYYIVFAKRDPAVPRLTAYMVDREAEGVVIDRFEEKIGLRGATTSNLKLDTLVTESDLLGEEDRGMRLALSTLVVGRITAAAQAVGMGIAAFEEAASWASRRQAFGGAVIDNQGIGFRLADLATQLSAARMLVYAAADAYDRGRDASNLGAMAKLHAAEVSHDAVNTAVQVLGAYGLCKPYRAERLYRDQRAIEIYEGTSEIQRVVLSRAIKAEALDRPAPTPVPIAPEEVGVNV